MPGKKKSVLPTADKALEWVEAVRGYAGGYSENEKKLIALADEVKKLRRELRAAQMKTRAGALRPVRTPLNADGGAEACMAFIDETGQPPMPKREWIDMLEEIISQCRTRAQLTRQEIRNEE